LLLVHVQVLKEPLVLQVPLDQQEHLVYQLLVLQVPQELQVLAEVKSLLTQLPQSPQEYLVL
jgi:hypothetical protein